MKTDIVSKIGIELNSSQFIPFYTKIIFGIWEVVVNSDGREQFPKQEVLPPRSLGSASRQEGLSRRDARDVIVIEKNGGSSAWTLISVALIGAGGAVVVAFLAGVFGMRSSQITADAHPPQPFSVTLNEPCKNSKEMLDQIAKGPADIQLEGYEGFGKAYGTCPEAYYASLMVKHLKNNNIAPAKTDPVRTSSADPIPTEVLLDTIKATSGKRYELGPLVLQPIETVIGHTISIQVVRGSVRLVQDRTIVQTGNSGQTLVINSLQAGSRWAAFGSRGATISILGIRPGDQAARKI